MHRPLKVSPQLIHIEILDDHQDGEATRVEVFHVCKLDQRAGLSFRALVLRAERQRTIASNIANADTPGYVARDLDFKAAMANATAGNSIRIGQQHHRSKRRYPCRAYPAAEVASGSAVRNWLMQPRPSPVWTATALTSTASANFVDNSVRYETTLRFINVNPKQS